MQTAARVKLALVVVAVLVIMALWSFLAGEQARPHDPRAILVQCELCSTLSVDG